MRKMLTLIALVSVSAVISATENNLSAEDTAKIEEVHRQYEVNWIKGDANGVRALFTEDCVLLPPHGDKPRLGQTGLNEYWFPPNAPATKITKLEVKPQRIGGNAEIAYAWGTDEVAWTVEQNGTKTSAEHKGIFLNVLRKQANGEWKISHHMWDDALEQH